MRAISTEKNCPLCFLYIHNALLWWSGLCIFIEKILCTYVAILPIILASIKIIVYWCDKHTDVCVVYKSILKAETPQNFLVSHLNNFALALSSSTFYCLDKTRLILSGGSRGEQTKSNNVVIRIYAWLL